MSKKVHFIQRHNDLDLLLQTNCCLVFFCCMWSNYFTLISFISFLMDSSVLSYSCSKVWFWNGAKPDVVIKVLTAASVQKCVLSFPPPHVVLFVAQELIKLSDMDGNFCRSFCYHLLAFILKTKISFLKMIRMDIGVWQWWLHFPEGFNYSAHAISDINHSSEIEIVGWPAEIGFVK